MLKRRKNITRDKNKLKSIENSIIEIEIENKLAEDRKQKKDTLEVKVIENMKDNPKVFYENS